MGLGTLVSDLGRAIGFSRSRVTCRRNLKNFQTGSSWPEVSKRDDYPEKSRSRIGGHGPAQLARRVLVAPGSCRRAPARSATCPTCTLPGHTCSCNVAVSQSHSLTAYLRQVGTGDGLCAKGSGDPMGIPFSLYQKIGWSGSFRSGPAIGKNENGLQDQHQCRIREI